MKKTTFFLILIMLQHFLMAQHLPIQIWELSPKQTPEHEKTIKSILVDEFDLEEKTTNYHRISVKPLMKDELLESFVAYFLHKDNYSVEVAKITLTDEMQVERILKNYQEQPADFQTPEHKGTCPDESVDMIFSTCETSIPTAVAAVDYAAQVAQDNGFKYKILKGSQENIQAIQNWLSCNNLILFGRVGHGYSNGIVLSDGNLTYNYFQNLSSNALNDKDLYFNSCEVHNYPLEPAIVNAGVEKFIGGNVNLAIGSSEEVFKCWLDKVITDNASITQSLTNCEQANYPYPGSHGISGNGSDYLPENNVSNTAPTPGIPENGAIAQGIIQFGWDSPIAAQAYRLQVSTTAQNWTAQNGFTSSSEPTTTIPVNISQAGTTYEWNNPTQGQTYYWTVRSWHANTGTTTYSQPVSFTYNSSTTYCESKGTNVVGEWISSVQVGAAIKTSDANGGYADFTGTVFYVSQGNSYGIELKPGFSSGTYNESWKVWIDFNQDKDFDDAGELVFSPALSSSTVSGSISIPTNALTGNTRMRISMKGDEAQSPCETFQYGEVEDYTINIASGGSNSPNVTIDHPTTVNVGENVTFSGTASSDIQNVKIKVGQWEIADETVTNGSYTFNYAFTSAGQNRDITANAYNSAGNLVATAESQITVQEVEEYSVTINHPSQGTLGEAVQFSGNTTGNIQNVVISVDGWEIANVNTTNGSYNFAYTFNSTGSNRSIVVKAFDNGDEVARAHSTITINNADNSVEAGLGVWLWYLDVTSFSSHTQLAGELSSMGVKKIYVKVADGAYDPATWPEVNDQNLVNIYKNAGLDVIAWSYNRPGSERAQADALYYAAKTGYEGFILDVEVEYNNKTTELHTLFQEFETARQDAINAGYATDEFKIGCTSWGNPEDQGMHVEIIDQYVDYHMPQTYTEIWNVLDNQEYWINRGTQEYRNMGCEKPIYHICAAEEGRITSSQINEYISIAGPNTSIWSIPKANMHSAIWPVLQNVNWNAYEYYESTGEKHNIVENSSNTSVYPNPAKNILHIDLPKNQLKQTEITIYDAMGRQIKKEKLQLNGTINIRNIDDGVYLLKINNGHNAVTQKVIIKN